MASVAAAAAAVVAVGRAGLELSSSISINRSSINADSHTPLNNYTTNSEAERENERMDYFVFGAETDAEVDDQR